MAWAKPQFGKGRIDWAGEFLAGETRSGPLEISASSDGLGWQVLDLSWVRDSDLAYQIVNNWRAAHSYPLQAMKMTLKRRAKSICPTAIVAQRLKRFASIQLKLNLSKKLGQHPNLSQMQDIGGCRAVMDTVEQVRRLERKFSEASKKNPLRGPQYFKTSDYIAKPKENGYRSVHLVYKFRTDSTTHSCYNGQRIEIQLRSRLQHYWATAVETYSTFTGEALKSNIGSDEWKRFFALVSSVIAISENSPVVPNTGATLDLIIPEMRSLHSKLGVNNVLSGWAATAKYTSEAENEGFKNAAMYLLVLDPDTFATTVYSYSAEEAVDANAQYAKIEKEQPNLQAVLVAADSVAALRAAYPNYYLDTTAFLGVVASALNAGTESRGLIANTPDQNL